jgi:hypothetical protein
LKIATDKEGIFLHGFYKLMLMVSHYFSVVKTVGEMLHHPWLLCKYIFDPSGIRKKYDESLAYCHQFVDNVSSPDFT